MRVLIISFILFISLNSVAQHCPWDCTGMIVLQPDMPIKAIDKFHLVLADENKRPITDTIYGTGKDTYDRCVFLSYDSFTKARSEKITIHHWYSYDTVYKFAKGNYIVKYNYCKYQGKKLYMRYLDQYNRALVFHYIEIPESNRIHLHDYNDELRNGQGEKMKEATKKNVIVLTCGDFLLREGDCK